MRTYLTRLTLSAAGVVLTGLGAAAAAHASDADLTLVEEPIYMETVPIQPPPSMCGVQLTAPGCLQLDAGPTLRLPFDPQLVDPDPSGDDDKPEEPSEPTPTEPSDDQPAETGDDESGEPEGEEPVGGGEPAAEPAGDGHGGQGAPSGDSGGNTSPAEEPAAADPAAEGAVDEPTAESDETTVAPVAQQTPTVEGGSRALFGVFAIALGALGLTLVGVGFARRLRPVSSPIR